MNKKVNTVLFVLGATVVNILIMIVILIGGLLLIGRFMSENAQQSAGPIVVVLLFFVAIAASFFLYNRFIKYLSTKIDMDKYFHPIFRTRGQTKKKE